MRKDLGERINRGEESAGPTPHPHGILSADSRNPFRSQPDGLSHPSYGLRSDYFLSSMREIIGRNAPLEERVSDFTSTLLLMGPSIAKHLSKRILEDKDNEKGNQGLFQSITEAALSWLLPLGSRFGIGGSDGALLEARGKMIDDLVIRGCTLFAEHIRHTRTEDAATMTIYKAPSPDRVARPADSGDEPALEIDYLHGEARTLSPRERNSIRSFYGESTLALYDDKCAKAGAYLEGALTNLLSHVDLPAVKVNSI